MYLLWAYYVISMYLLCTYYVLTTYFPCSYYRYVLSMYLLGSHSARVSSSHVVPAATLICFLFFLSFFFDGSDPAPGSYPPAPPWVIWARSAGVGDGDEGSGYGRGWGQAHRGTCGHVVLHGCRVGHGRGARWNYWKCWRLIKRLHCIKQIFKFHINLHNLLDLSWKKGNIHTGIFLLNHT